MQQPRSRAQPWIRTGGGCGESGRNQPGGSRRGATLLHDALRRGASRMHRPTSGLGNDVAARIAALETESPQWRTWLRLLRVAAAAFDDVDFRYDPAPQDGPSVLPSREERNAPLLHGTAFRLEAELARKLLEELLAAASDDDADPSHAALARWTPTPLQALALLEASIRFDNEAIAAVAARASVPADSLEVVARFLTLPLLRSAARRLEARRPAFWAHGYCPVCGARPVMAELRGLDRARLLRCGRCGWAWQVSWLRCAYCGESDHERLGTLVPEDDAETIKVETCDSCRGYLKAVTTLQESSLLELLIRDLETLAFDIVAVERGYSRPEDPGYALVAVVIPHRS